MTKAKTNIIYLGNKGAGPALAFTFSNELSTKDSLENSIIRSSELDDVFKRSNFAEKQTTRKTASRTLFAAICACAFAKNKPYAFTPMHSPLSIPLTIILQLVGIETYSIIHDFSPHEGDRKRTLKLANSIICHLDTKTFFLTHRQKSYASRKHPELKSKFIKIKHPTFSHFEQQTRGSKQIFDFLFFGRIERYKGINFLVEAFRILKTKHPESKLLIAGPQSKKSPILDLPQTEGLTYDIRYIPEFEIPNLITKSACIVLPYKNATQSGVLALAATFGLPVLSTPCQGIIEQAADYHNISFCEEFTPQSLSEAMQKTFNSKSKYQKTHIVESGITDYIRKFESQKTPNRIL